MPLVPQRLTDDSRYGENRPLLLVGETPQSPLIAPVGAAARPADAYITRAVTRVFFRKPQYAAMALFFGHEILTPVWYNRIRNSLT